MGQVKIIKETKQGKQEMIIVTISDWIIKFIAFAFGMLELAFAMFLFVFSFTLFCFIMYTIVDYFTS